MQRSSVGMANVVPEPVQLVFFALLSQWHAEYSPEWQHLLSYDHNFFSGCFSEKSALTFFFFFFNASVCKIRYNRLWNLQKF